MQKDELRRKVQSSLIWKFLERGGVSGGALLVQIVMARLLMPEDFGALAIMLVFVLVGTTFSVSGFNTALVQVKDLKQEDYSTVFWISLTTATVLWAGLFVGAPWIARAFSLPAMTNPLRAMGALFVLHSVYAILTADVQRNLAFKRVFKASAVSLVIASFFGIGAALLGMGLWALVVYQILNVLVSCLMLFAQTNWRPKFEFSKARAQLLFGFSWKLLVSALIDVVYGSLSDLIIGKQFSATSLGFVSQGKKYPGALVQVLDGAVQPVMFSAVARVQSDRVAVKAVVRRTLKTSLLIVLPAMALLATVAEPLVVWLLGEKWHDAVIFFQMYCFIYALWPIHTTNLTAINGMGRSDLFLKLELAKKILGLLILLITVCLFSSPVAIVVGFMIDGILSAFINMFPTWQVIGYHCKEQVKDIFPIAFLSAMCGCICFGVLSCIGLDCFLSTVFVSVLYFFIFAGLAILFRLEGVVYIWKRLRH